jgi:PAS domain S-box-containing protein
MSVGLRGVEMDGWLSFLGRAGYLPHGVCIAWSPGMLWSMVTADLAIAGAYFSIPLAIGRFVRHRDLGPFAWVAWLFGAFIFACGLSHVMDVWTLWQPDYGAQVLIKVLTAALSMATAMALWPLIPRALSLPTVRQLQTVVASLEAEVGRRKSVEQHVQALEQSLAVTLASIDAGFIATDRKGRVTQMNQVAEVLTGHTLADARHGPLWRVFDLLEPAQADAGRNPVQVLESLAASGALDRQILVRARHGTVLPLQLHVAVNQDETEPAPGLILVFRDMTSANLAESDNRRLAAVVESSNDAIITKTLEGRITSWNGAATRMFGYAEAEALGMPVQDLLPPDRKNEEMRILADLAHGKTVPAFDTLRRTKDGDLVEVSVTISPLRDATGRIVGGSKIARDITARRRVEAAVLDSERSRLRADRLQAANQQIQQTSRMKSQFLANMSHELRTPLNAIIGFAELLQGGTVPPESARGRDYLGHIATSGRHLLQLINDVLDLSKVEAGKFDFYPAPLDLQQVIGEVCDVLQTDAMRKRLRIDIAIEPSIGPLVLDAARLKQVLYNYLSNAIKFTPDSGHITVRARADGADHFRVEVEDNGPGIEPGDLKRLFVEFQQLDASYSKRHQGTGLGLALTRRLVQAQGGQVGVHSTPGVGSVFHFVLPRQPVAVQMEEGLDGLRVLVIEPDSVQQARLMHAVNTSGYRADDAANAAEALHRTAQYGYHAITLGMQLPDEQALLLLADIRSGGPSRDTPVVAMTMPSAAGALAAFGIADVMFKPLRRNEVAGAMSRLSRPADRPTRVLVIDDDPMALDLMRTTLTALDIEAFCLGDGRVALADLGRIQPDALILDLMMPEFDGFAVLDALQASPVWRDLPVYIWTSMILTEEEVLRLAQSAQAIVSKGGGAVETLLDSLRRVRKAET